jgi:putative endonuclease
MPGDAQGQESGRPRAPHFTLGAHGEALAIEHLEQRGYRIVAANFSLPIGRNTRDVIVNAEIDIVAYDGAILCFVEVKTRASDEIATPETNVDRRKRRQIARAARGYRRMFGLTDSPFRYDVVSVVGNPDHTRPRIELHKAFWTDEQLQKKSWREPYWD